MSLITDTILGFVVGDAMGVPVEFESREYLKKNRIEKMEGYMSYMQPAGTWSDDSSMTLATIDSIINKQNIDYDDIMNKFLNWYQNAEYTATDMIFDIGDTTRNKFKMLSSKFAAVSDNIISYAEDLVQVKTSYYKISDDLSDIANTSKANLSSKEIKSYQEMR